MSDGPPYRSSGYVTLRGNKAIRAEDIVRRERCFVRCSYFSTMINDLITISSQRNVERMCITWPHLS